MLGGQVLTLWVLMLLFLGLAADTHRPDLGHSHCQPEPLHTTCGLHFAVMPAPQAALKIFEACFNPGAHPIPTHLSLLWFQIGEYRPGRFVTSFPMHEQRTRQAAGFPRKAFHCSFPTCAWRGGPSADPIKGLLASCSCFDPQIDAQERMPAIVDNRLEQPASI